MAEDEVKEGYEFDAGFKDMSKPVLITVLVTFVICLCIGCWVSWHCWYRYRNGWLDWVLLMIVGSLTAWSRVPAFILVWFFAYLYGIEDWTCPVPTKGGLRDIFRK